MQPYYSEGGIVIFHCDAREVAEDADVLITDPPYGVEFTGKVTRHTRGEHGYTTADDPRIGPEVVSQYLTTVSRGVVFPGIRRLYDYPTPNDIGCVYCPSGAGIGKWGFTLFHPVLFYGTRPGSLKPTSMTSFATSGPSEHPCPKPLSWMRWVLTLAALDGDVIIDPFMGSGTTLLAAREAGHRAIGIEVEEQYCEIAANRLSQGVLPLAHH